MSNDIYIFIFFLTLLNVLFIYKLVSGISSIYNYKKGKSLKAEVMSFSWVKSPPARLSYLFPKEQLEVTFRFVLGDDMYEKTELDIHFKFNKMYFRSLPKIGGKIDVYVPRNNNPNKVTINKVDDTILPLMGLLVLIILSGGILSLILLNLFN